MDKETISVEELSRMDKKTIPVEELSRKDKKTIPVEELSREQLIEEHRVLLDIVTYLNYVVVANLNEQLNDSKYSNCISSIFIISSTLYLYKVPTKNTIEQIKLLLDEEENYYKKYSNSNSNSNSNGNSNGNSNSNNKYSYWFSQRNEILEKMRMYINPPTPIVQKSNIFSRFFKNL